MRESSFNSYDTRSPTKIHYHNYVCLKPSRHFVLRSLIDPGLFVLSSVCSKHVSFLFPVIGNDFREQPKATDVALGSDAVLECRPPRGEPEPRVRWRKDSDPVKPSERISISETGSLKIKDARKEDSGVYVCIAYNVGGEKESSPARLAVRGWFHHLYMANE